MTYYSDKILLFVKLSVILFALALLASFSQLFIDFKPEHINLLNTTLSYLYLSSLIALFAYVYGSYIESQKLITCTGCKVVNYLGNFIAYLVINSVLFGVNYAVW